MINCEYNIIIMNIVQVWHMGAQKEFKPVLPKATALERGEGSGLKGLSNGNWKGQQQSGKPALKLGGVSMQVGRRGKAGPKPWETGTNNQDSPSQSVAESCIKCITEE